MFINLILNIMNLSKRDVKHNNHVSLKQIFYNPKQMHGAQNKRCINSNNDKNTVQSTYFVF